VSATASFDVVVSVHGPVAASASSYADEKVRRALAGTRAPVIFARVALEREQNPSLERPCLAKASVDVDGHVVRAHVAAPTMTEAIDGLESHLRRRLQRLAERREARRHETGIAAPGEWRHGDLPTERPEYFPRPIEERRLLRRKTYSLHELTPEEAAWELELLDYDFHLFREPASGEEAVVFRRPGGGLGLQVLEGASPPGASGSPIAEVAPAPAMELEAAIEELDLTDARFVFFRDRGTGRGAVVYRRYDGHYGLVVPAS
jgi:ribosome-associated translation inhibitor RaiA